MSLTAIGDAAPSEDAPFAVDSEYAGHCARLALHGELDLATVGVLDDALRRAWSHEDIRRMEIDLRGLRFIGSSGVAALLEANAHARESGCGLTLVRAPAHVHRIFEITGIDTQFAFRPGAARRDERSGPLRVVG